MNLAQIAQHADDLDRAEDFYTVLLQRGPLARFDDAGLLFFDLDEWQAFIRDSEGNTIGLIAFQRP